MPPKKAMLLCITLLLLASSAAQQESRPKGVIYGYVVVQDGQPAKGIGLTAMPLGVALATVLPHTKANDAGEYRFENLPWWGRYTVYAEDDDAGYSTFSTGTGGGHPPEVELTPERREAELNLLLPPKAGLVTVQLTNRRTGAAISAMRIAVMALKNPVMPLFTASCSSTQVILVPPDKDLLLHVTSDGFREWNESVGKGKDIRLSSGTRVTLIVQLEPSD